MENNSYVLRKAAGIYWLIDCGQRCLPCRPPIRLNETGARIWQLLEQGRTVEEIAAEIAGTEDAPVQAVTEDVRDFARQLQTALDGSGV